MRLLYFKPFEECNTSLDFARTVSQPLLRTRSAPSTIAHPRERRRGRGAGVAAPGDVCDSAPRPFQGMLKPAPDRLRLVKRPSGCQPDGKACRRVKAAARVSAHGQERGRRSFTPPAWLAIRPATCSRRYLRLLGSQAARSVPRSSSLFVQESRSMPVSTSSSQAAFMAYERNGRLRSPEALAQRIESSTAARWRCTCSRRAMRLPFWFVRMTWKRWPPESLKESCAPCLSYTH